MITYARYKYYNDFTAKVVGNVWHKVTKECKEYRPSGLCDIIVINGLSVKANHCEIVQVFNKGGNNNV